MSFEQLKNIRDYNIEQERLSREEELTECPYDAWPLNINSRGEKSCPICGRVYEGLQGLFEY